MNGEFLFSDTFDNLSFSAIGKYVTEHHDLNGSLKEIDKKNVGSDTRLNNISVDDSLFFDESFNTPNFVNENEILKKSFESPCSSNITDKTESIKNNTIYKNVLNTIEKTVKSSKSLFKSNIKDSEDDEKKKFESNLGELMSNKNAINAKFKFSNSLTDILTESSKLSEWGLPEAILRKYESRKIIYMFPWQVECLNNLDVLENNKNLIYSAPTSAGKTLVAEILAIKTVLERQKKVIFILPFVSVVREKMFYFQDIFGGSGVRVEGFMGSYNPPGGFHAVQIAVCTIEKANSLINRLLEEGSLDEIGTVIVDELHLLGDASRGYLLELLLTKLRYMSSREEGVNIQIIGMSATLPNLEILAKWLEAELYTTTFRPIPLYEQCIVCGEIYNNEFKLKRKLEKLEGLESDTDNILQLCLETILISCSVLVFCPTKNWCENLAQQLAAALLKIGRTQTQLGQHLREQINAELITEVLEQLKCCPVGLDSVLSKTVSFAVAFHHAGLTMDERDIIEGAFHRGALRILIATSTLSSGVNLPAKRVIIRTPKFHGKAIDTLTYRQMIGRAGRMGKDTSGDSILICQKTDYNAAKELMSACLNPIESCLEGSGKLKRAILEVIASGVASTPDDVALFTSCTLLASSTNVTNPIEDSVHFLQENEFIRLQTLEDGTSKYVATPLGKACLSSSMPPEEGLALFAELQKARQCFVLETELHLIYLVTPYSACNQWVNIDWMMYLNLWDKLPASMKRVGDLVGIKESYIVNGTRGKLLTNSSKAYHQLQVHKRFYTALALQDLVNEIPLNDVAQKFNCSRGMLQSLQQSAGTFAGMVTTFSRKLGWSSVQILISQFQDRMQFGVNRDLLDLMRLSLLNGPRARVLYNNGIESLIDLSRADVCTLENILHKAIPFESEKERDGETVHEAQKRNKTRIIWITGKQGLTPREAATMFISYARRYLQLEMGLVEAKWDSDQNQSNLSRNTIISDADVTTNINKIQSIKVLNSTLNKNQNISGIISKEISSENCVNGSINNSDNNFEINAMDPFKERHNIINSSNCLSEILSSPNIHLTPNSSTTKPNGISDAISIEKSLNKNISSQSLFSESLNSDVINLEQNIVSDNSFTDSHTNRKHEDMQSEMKIQKTADYSLQDDSIIRNTALENAFESTQFNQILIKNNTDMEISTCNNTFLRNAFESQFTFNAPNSPHESPEKVNKSNDLIANSQDELESLLYNSSRSLKKIHRKRIRKISENRTSYSGDEHHNETPPKKTKYNRTKHQQFKITYCITEGGFSKNETSKENSKFEVNTKTPIQLNNLEIINVCDNRKIYETFTREILQQKILSLSIACCGVTETKPKIGKNLNKNDSEKSKELTKTNFVHKSRQVKGVSVAWGNNVAYYICFENDIVRNWECVSLLKSILANKDVCFRMFDSKEQIKVLKLCCNIEFMCLIEDPKVADWLLQPEGKENNLQAMTLIYTPEAVGLTQMVGKCKGIGSVSLDLHDSTQPRLQSSVEAVVTWHLVNSIKEALQEQNEKLLLTYEIEMKSISCLAKMELDGFGVDVKKLQLLTDSLKEQCHTLERAAFQLAGRHFSMISSKDVAKVLGIYNGKKVSTNKQTLEKSGHPMSKIILLWRKVNSTLTKMAYPFLRLVENGRIHGNCITYNCTGRISMHEPNLQNVPKDFTVDNSFNQQPITISCRSVFEGSAGSILVSADYCQLELRILAHLSQDSVLCPIMRTDQDVFKSIAAKWKNVPESEVDNQMRQNVKQISYGIIYGIGCKTLSDQLLLTEEEAKHFVDEFHNKYPGIKKYIKETINQCRINGYVETLANRRRYLPHINHENIAIKNQAERQAVNTTIQGSAADIAKNAMVLIEKSIHGKFLNSKHTPKLVLHLHDELVYEVTTKYLKNLAKILKKCMEESVQLSVPFPVKLKSGYSWGQMEDLII